MKGLYSELSIPRPWKARFRYPGVEDTPWEVVGDGDGRHEVGPRFSEEDAKIVAAAWELFEACYAIVEGNPRAYELALAATNKALIPNQCALCKKPLALSFSRYYRGAMAHDNCIATNEGLEDSRGE